jgi:hypothetical protein
MDPIKQTNLPIDLLVWIVKEEIIKPSVLRTFLHLKFSYNDRFLWSQCLANDIADDLQINIKTVRKHLDELLRVKFLSYDKRTNTCFIRSKYKLVPLGLRISKCQVKVSIEHFDCFTEFIVAATVAYMVKKQMIKHKLALINDDALQRSCKINAKCHMGLPISLSYIANFLGKSISWVDKYKAKAKKLRLLKVRRHLVDTGVSWSCRDAFLWANDLRPGRIKKYRGNVYLIGADYLSSNVHAFNRKKV